MNPTTNKPGWVQGLEAIAHLIAAAFARLVRLRKTKE
jgi:hypothetical protein